MQPIVKEPFSPRRRSVIAGFRWAALRLLCRRVYEVIFRTRDFSRFVDEDVCMILLLVALSLITLLLPWILL